MKMESNKNLLVKPVLFGFIGTFSILLVYFLIVSLANSFSHAIDEFVRIWYWMSPLVILFGIQIALFTYIKGYHKIKAATATTSVAATGSVSTTSMVACCAHHLADVLPFLGISAAAIFFNKYQILFLLIGILSGLIGINLMLKIIQKHNLYDAKNRILSNILKLDMKKMLYYNAVASLIVFLITLYVVM